MGPPAALAVTQPGGFTTGRKALTGSQIEAMSRAAHGALDSSGVSIGPAKIARLVRRFSKEMARNGATFHEFLSGHIRLTTEQRYRLLRNPEWSRVIAYADPTGESAVNNVMRGSGA